jgi:hypothetical protein
MPQGYRKRTSGRKKIKMTYKEFLAGNEIKDWELF